MLLNWQEITSVEDLESHWNETPNTKLYFKHSTRCSISSMALKMFEREWDSSNDCELLFIDLIQYRDVSNLLAKLSNVEHQSPQVIVVKNNVVVYHDSHGTIDATKIKTILNS